MSLFQIKGTRVALIARWQMRENALFNARSAYVEGTKTYRGYTLAIENINRCISDLEAWEETPEKSPSALAVILMRKRDARKAKK